MFSCKCGKVYKHRQSLHVHKKKCTVEEDSDSDKDKEIEELKKQLREEREANRRTVAESMDTIATLSTKVGTTVNVFLNEHCKDAMSLQDFVNKLSVSLIDMDNTKQISLLNSKKNYLMYNSIRKIKQKLEKV